jgi:hypothetical protein
VSLLGIVLKFLEWKRSKHWLEGTYVLRPCAQPSTAFRLFLRQLEIMEHHIHTKSYHGIQNRSVLICVEAGAVHHHYAFPRPTLRDKDRGRGVEVYVHCALKRGWPPLKRKMPLQSIHIFFAEIIPVKFVAKLIRSVFHAKSATDTCDLK